MTAQPAQDEETVTQYRGVIVIEWPPPGGGPYSAMAGWPVVVITDAATGRPVTTCSHADITVHADVSQLVTADLTLFTDADGEPILDGEPALDGKEVRTGVFPFLVAGMKVRQA